MYVKENELINIEQKMQELNKYNSEEFCAYQDGYYDGQLSGVKIGMLALREILIEKYHELPTTLAYTEQLIDFGIDAVIKQFENKKY